MLRGGVTGVVDKYQEKKEENQVSKTKPQSRTKRIQQNRVEKTVEKQVEIENPIGGIRIDREKP